MTHFKTTEAYKKAMLRESEDRWILADFILEDIPGSGRGGDQSKKSDSLTLGDLIVAYAAEVGEDPATIKYQRSMAVRWPKQYRNPKNTWGVHAELMSHPERFDLIKKVMTVTEARGDLGKPPAWGERKTMTAWEKLNKSFDFITAARHEIEGWNEWLEDRQLLESGLAAESIRTAIRDLSATLENVQRLAYLHEVTVETGHDEFDSIVAQLR